MSRFHVILISIIMLCTGIAFVDAVLHIHVIATSDVKSELSNAVSRVIGDVCALVVLAWWCNRLEKYS